MSNFKLPHWAQVGLALAVLVVTWLMNEQASGQLVLPAAVISVLTVVKTVLGLFSDSASAGKPPSAGGPSRLVSMAFVGICVASLFAIGSYRVTETARGETRVVYAGAENQGCSWFAANKNQVIDDVGAVASCIVSQLFQGATDPAQVASACVGATVADVEQILSSLINFYTEPSDAAAPPSGAPASVSAETLGRLKAMRVAAHAQLSAGAK